MNEVTKTNTPGNSEGMRALVDNEAFRDKVAAVLPSYLTPETMIKLAGVAASRNPKLLECTKTSILMAVITSAQLGLDCSGATGEAYLVPHWNNSIKAYEAVFIQGYKGKIHLITREGGVEKVEAKIIYKNEVFEVSYGTSPEIKHYPMVTGDRGEIIAAYAVATLPSGRTQFELMRMDELDKIKEASLKKTRGKGPWKDHTSEMIRKTPVHRLAKYLPLASKVRAEVMMDGAPYEEPETPRNTPRLMNPAEIKMEEIKADKRREKAAEKSKDWTAEDAQAAMEADQKERDRTAHTSAVMHGTPEPEPTDSDYDTGQDEAFEKAQAEKAHANDENYCVRDPASTGAWVCSFEKTFNHSSCRYYKTTAMESGDMCGWYCGKECQSKEAIKDASEAAKSNPVADAGAKDILEGKEWQNGKEQRG